MPSHDSRCRSLVIVSNIRLAIKPQLRLTIWVFLGRAGNDVAGSSTRDCGAIGANVIESTLQCNPSLSIDECI